MAEMTQTEINIFAYLLGDKKFFPAISSRIKTEQFADHDIGIIYKFINFYYNKYKQICSEKIINDVLTKGNCTSAVMLFNKYLPQIKNVDISKEGDLNYYIDEFMTGYKRRQLVNISSDIISGLQANANIDNTIGTIKNYLQDIDFEETDVEKEGIISDSAQQRLDKYLKREENPEAIQMIPTGFRCIDSLNGGFVYGELVYVIGRKGDGKSVLLLNLAHNMWRCRKNVILFSLEINKEDYERRFDARAALVQSNGLKHGNLSDEEKNKYIQYINALKEGKAVDGSSVGTIYIVDIPGKCSPSIVRAKTEKIETELSNKYNTDFKFDAVIIDYSQIMVPDVPTEQKRDALGQIALDLKRFARESNKVVLTASQMTRLGKQETSMKNGHAGTEHVAESDQISDHIDWGIAIRSTSNAEGIIESFKIRDGAPFSFKFIKNYHRMEILEIDESAWDNFSLEEGTDDE